MVEWFEILSPDGEPAGYATRELCHRCPALLHRVVHALVVNSHGELFLQKRSLEKDIQPGKWDTSVGGHVNPGEAPEDAVRRETEEELGFIPVELVYLYDYIWESEREREQVRTYLCRYDGKCHPDPEEIEEGRWWTPDEIDEQLSSGIFTPNFIEEYQRYKNS
jgi:isopentenyldiphosphate isomerase